MIDLSTVNQIKKAPLQDRFQIIETILQSLKEDIHPRLDNQKQEFKYFKIRKYSLGGEIHVDRDELYSERGL
ncbi:hypothetical protein H8E88_05720 [candidate division KSB1 bacterium]|nr:hypothetical protein [candidate division KSB1 bacterium]MBL7095160.1 hypothetical protein [candidate division KSB1 bacterium]